MNRGIRDLPTYQSPCQKRAVAGTRHFILQKPYCCAPGVSWNTIVSDIPVSLTRLSGNLCLHTESFADSYPPIKECRTIIRAGVSLASLWWTILRQFCSFLEVSALCDGSRGVTGICQGIGQAAAGQWMD